MEENGDFTLSELFDARLINCTENWTRNIKNRAYNGLIYVINGALTITRSNISATAEKNHILFIEKNASYKIVSESFSDIIVLSFDEPNPEVFSGHSIILIDENSIIVTLLHDLVSAFKKSNYTDKIKCKSIFYNLAYHIIKTYKSVDNTISNDRLITTVIYMHENFDKKISITDLSKKAFLSCTHYRRMFKQKYDTAPLDYLNSIRINKAKQLINTGLYTLCEIAQLTGFSDVYYFSRAFKQKTGITPAKYKTHSE